MSGAPIELFAPERVAADARRVSQRGATWLAVGVKLELRIVPDGPLQLAPGATWLTEPIYERNDPTRSTVEAADFALARGPAEITAWVIAHRWPGRVEQPLRLAVFRGGQALLDKSVSLCWQPEDGPSQAAHWGLAACSEANPIGRASSARLLPLRGATAGACFAPLSSVWPLRRRLRGSTATSALRLPEVELSDDFDTEFLRAAPLDQRTPGLRAGDWILVEGLSPTLPRLATQLPRVAVVATLGEDSFGQPTCELVPTRLHLEPERSRATLLFTGELPAGDAARTHTVFISVDGERGGRVAPPVAPPATSLDATRAGPSDAPVEVAPYALPKPRTKASAQTAAETPFAGGPSRTATPASPRRPVTLPLAPADLRPPEPIAAPLAAKAPSPPLQAVPPGASESPVAPESEPEPPEDELSPRAREAERLRSLGVSEEGIAAAMRRRVWFD
jgi:hypothetical protein